MSEIHLKKFLVVPFDALLRLEDRHADSAAAIERAKDRCAEESRTMYVVELRQVVTRETPPVTVRKL